MAERRSRPIYAQRHVEHDHPPATDRDNAPSRRQHARGPSSDISLANWTPPRRRRRADYTSDDDDETAFRSSRDQSTTRWPQRKRRRIDADAAPLSTPPIKYGHYGQVEPGRLKMLMISCDGGEHTDPRYPHVYLGPHNVLKSDRSVYCSARKDASIVLRHADDTPFSLTRLAIVAPENGFTAPVKQGVAYIAMTLDALKKYTNSAIGFRPHSPPPYASLESSQDYNDDLEGITEFTVALRDVEDSLASLSAVEVTSELAEDLAGESMAQFHRRVSEARLPGESLSHLANRSYANNDLRYMLGVLSQRLTIERQPHESRAEAWARVCAEVGAGSAARPVHDTGTIHATLVNDVDLGPEDVSTPEVLDYRQQRAQLLLRRQDNLRWRDRRLQRSLPLNDELIFSPPRLRYPLDEQINAMARSIARAEEVTSHETEIRTEEPRRNGTAGNDESDVMSVRFTIRDDAHHVTIQFSVPIAGRFILLKLAGAQPGLNVDIQSVICLGYGGPRFFPAIDIR